ncbi:MAG: gliding motility-associated C-terminal domain-containing protein [Flavobacteriales bacterium]|nr:gliding motility-associated C-terminal domain-containing protein [Flavobacteriales bacterium]
MKKAVLFFAVFCIYVTLKAQEKWTLTNDALSNRSFIENKGQFDDRNLQNIPILYAVDHGSVQVFFTRDGITYAFFKTEKNYERKKGQKGVPRLLVDTDFIHVKWENANPNLKVTAKEQTADYHTYPVKKGGVYQDVNGIRGFKKLIYQNIYPKIDLEYTFHKEEGLKYSFVLHPGADPSLIKLKVEGNRNVFADDNGNAHIATKFGDIIDHKPYSFVASAPAKEIPTEYVLDGQVISFELGPYDNKQKVILDPWTITPNAFSNSNKIWEIETDQNNNVYVYGGDSPMRLRKYNAAGILQWTYNTPWDTANYWVGTLKTDLAGNSYITSGTSGTVRKINTGGTMDWNAANNGPIPEIEFWNLTFNCDYTKLYCGGMRAANGINIASYRGTVFELSMANGQIVQYKDVGFNTGGFIPTIKEVRSVVYSPNQRIYYLTLDSIGSLDAAFTQQYQVSSGFNFTYGIPAYGVTNQGIHAIAATTDFIYTQNGNTLQKRNIVNGAIISSAPIPGGISNTVPFVGGNTPGNSGLVVDSCGNVYVGSANGVYKFDGNLSPLGSFATPAAVYDVAINYNGEVVACGNNFITSIGNLSPCDPPPVVCLNCLEITPAGPFCSTDGPVNLTANNAGGTWSGPGITNASLGTFNPTVAGIGTHVIHYTLPNPLSCGQDSITIIVNDCSTLVVCLDANGNFTVTNGNAPYTWENQTTVQDCSACLFGCLFPTGCAVNVLAWTPFATGQSIPPPANYPIRLTDAAGNQLVINNAQEVQPCAVCPPLSVTVSSQQNITCAGLSNGQATVSATGGNAPYTYTWLPGNLNGASQSGLSVGNYTVNVTDADGCPGSVLVSITQPQPLALNVSSTETSCTQNTGTVSANATGGTASYTYQWEPGALAGPVQTGLGVGTYTVTVTDANGCNASATVNVNTLNGPQVTITSSTDITCFQGADGTATADASGGTGTLSYVWTPSGGNSPTASGLSAGTYTVTVTDQAECSAVATVTLTDGPQINLELNGAPADCGASNGTAEVAASGGNGGFSYAWSPAGGTADVATGLSSGNYTVLVTDVEGCTAQGDYTVGVIVTDSTLQVSVDVIPESCLGNDGIATAIVTGGLPPYTFLWNGGINPDSATVVGLTAGNYIVVVGDQCYSIPVNVVVDQAFSIPSKELPNIITPNGDGYNDALKVGNQFDAADNFFCTIYNRWGVPMHKTDDKTINWIPSAKISDGVYFIVVTYTDCTGKREKISSTVTVSK